MPSFASSLTGLLAAASLVAGQIVSPCNPVKGDNCPPDKAFGRDYFLDFTTASYDDLKKDWNVASLTSSQVSFDKGKGAGFTIFGSSGAPTLISNEYMFFGKVEVVAQAAPGHGIITCVVLASDCEDEIDWEWVGSHNGNVETNYYAKPGTNPKYNTYNGNLSVSNPTGSFHTYTVEWTPDWMTYAIDGAVLKKSYAKDSNNGVDWPQTPMQVRLGSWVAGAPGAPQGTVDWAGGLVNPADAPFVAWFKSVRITDYGNGYSGATEYIYKDRSGFAPGIEVVGGVKAAMPGTDSSLVPPTPSSSSSVSSSPLSTGGPPAKNTGSGDGGSPSQSTTTSESSSSPAAQQSSLSTSPSFSTTVSAAPMTTSSMAQSMIHTSTATITAGPGKTSTTAPAASTTASKAAAAKLDLQMAALLPVWAGMLLMWQ